MNILITGGAGFIGCNTAEHFARQGAIVTILDNLSRKGSTLNLDYLQDKFPGFLKFRHGDMRNWYEVSETLRENSFDYIFHFAAQVAVTTSLISPREDFDVNAKGTLNLLEAIRLFQPETIVVFTSTNKVYGNLEHNAISEVNGRYEFRDFPDGIAEDAALDFHSPYGCSKGVADQMVRDYYRIYGIKTLVFRQSCIYGYRQFGVEDQGWLAWFTIAAVFGLPITIYGDGKQYRDVLFIDDLLSAFDKAILNIDAIAGRIYNIGGAGFGICLLEATKLIERYSGKKIRLVFGKRRPGDQPVYISNCGKARREFGWKPDTSAEEGLKKLFDWVDANKSLIAKAGIMEGS